MTAALIIEAFNNMGSSAGREGMARFGINSNMAFGLKMKTVRAYAKKLGCDHPLALELWKTGYLEARILAGLIADKQQVTEQLMEAWVNDFNSWDLCDQTVSNLFDKHPLAYKKCMEWSQRGPTFVKRAGFAMMATLAVHDKAASDEHFLPFLNRIEEAAGDERNFVKKAISWALRQIGKRNIYLNKRAIETAARLRQQDSKAARWIASNALSELKGQKVQDRLQCKK